MGKAAGAARLKYPRNDRLVGGSGRAAPRGVNHHPERSRLHVGGVINVWLFLLGLPG
jgi:hypothetical protein